MNPFHVWVRPLGNTCRMRVDGMKNAQWLLGCLGRSFIFKTAAPMNEEADSSCCTFRLEYGPRMSQRGLEKLLATIPEVTLMTDPA